MSLIFSPRANSDKETLMGRMIHDEGTSLEDLHETSFQRIRESIGENTQVVLIGEATHGTQEFYKTRAELTKVLLNQEGFDAVLCEGDFPPFFECNRFVGGAPRERTSITGATKSNNGPFQDRDELEKVSQVMSQFKDRFPEWMWLNDITQDFVLWLRDFNQKRAASSDDQTIKPLPIQLLGLDIYSMFKSTDEVISYLIDKGEIELARLARERYSTLDSFRPEPGDYSRALSYDRVPSQADNVARMLNSLYKQEQRMCDIPGDGHEYFNALENARVVSSAEAYYRHMFVGGDVTWNIRDTAFLDMIEETIAFVEHRNRERGIDRKARVVVWAHNSHVGDSDATENSKRGQFNVGHLCREAFGKENVFIVGFTTHSGTVRAALRWGGDGMIMKLNPSHPSSHENVLHQVAKKRHENAFGYVLRNNPSSDSLVRAKVDEAAQQVLSQERYERFVGVQYARKTELRSHYSVCRLSDQYDFVIHVDCTSALRIEKVDHGPPAKDSSHSRHKKWDAILTQDPAEVPRLTQDVEMEEC